MADHLMDTVDLNEIRKILEGSDNSNNNSHSLDEILAEMGTPSPSKSRRDPDEIIKNSIGISISKETTSNHSLKPSDDVSYSINKRETPTYKDDLPYLPPSNQSNTLNRNYNDGFNTNLKSKSTPNQIKKSSFKKYDTARLNTGRLDNKGSWRDVIGDSSKLSPEAPEEKLSTTHKLNLVQNKPDAEQIIVKDPKLSEKSCKRRVKSLTKRSILVLLIWILSCYLSFAYDFSLPLPNIISFPENTSYYILSIISLQIIAMLVVIDVVGMSIYNLFHRKAGFEALAVVAGISTILHGISTILFPENGIFLPFSAVTIGALFFSVISVKQKIYAKQNTYQVCATTETPVGIFVKEEESIIGVKEKVATRDDFLKELTRNDVSVIVSRVYVPLAILLAIVLAFLATILTGNIKLYFWVLSAILCASATFGIITSFSYPYSWICKLFANEGIAISPTRNVSVISDIETVILTDDDIFPKDAVSIQSMKIFGNYSSEQMLAYALALLDEANLSIAQIFHDLLKEKYGRPVYATNVASYEAGGLSADINNDNILLGTSAFVVRMGIRMPEEIKYKDALYLTINREIVAVFAMKYDVSANMYNAFSRFTDLKFSPILAVRNFMITVPMVEKIFELKRGLCQFPNLDKRIRHSRKGDYEHELPCAILSRDNVSAFSLCIKVMSSFKIITRLNFIVSIFGSLIGMLLMAYLAYSFAHLTLTPYNLLCYNIIWSAPVFLISQNLKQ